MRNFNPATVADLQEMKMDDDRNYELYEFGRAARYELKEPDLCGLDHDEIQQYMNGYRDAAADAECPDWPE